MAEITLVAETGRTTGSRASNRLRAEGKVPGTVYGLGRDPETVAVEWRALRLALTTDAGLNALIDLHVGGDAQLTIVKELQRHPVRRTVSHVDFLRVSRDVAITVEVPVVLIGEALVVTQADGLIDQVLHNLAINAKPADIPNEITVDISGLEIGDSVRVSDLALPEGVTTDVDGDDPVAMAQAARVEVEPEAPEGEEAEAAEGAEGAEGGPADGGSGGSGGGAGESGGGDE